MNKKREMSRSSREHEGERMVGNDHPIFPNENPIYIINWCQSISRSWAVHNIRSVLNFINDPIYVTSWPANPCHIKYSFNWSISARRGHALLLNMWVHFSFCMLRTQCPDRERGRKIDKLQKNGLISGANWIPSR